MRPWSALLLTFTPFVCFSQINYTYDSSGHLTKANYGANGLIVYTYDPAGNLTGRSIQSGNASVITSVSTANGGSFIAQNTFVVIKGNNLVPTSTPAAGVIWSTAPSFATGEMPTQLGGIGVSVNGKPAYIYFLCSAATSSVCSSDQINILTPLDNTTGPVQVVVNNGNSASAPYTADMQAVAPAFLLFGATNYIAATHADGSIVGPTTLYPGLSTPAQPGETIVAYAVGFGLPATPLIPGASTQSGQLSITPTCTIGNLNARVVFAGLVAPGLYQLNLQIPGSGKPGDNSIACGYGGTTTPTSALITLSN